MYLCTRNYDLKRGGTFETAKAGTFHSVTAGTLIPLSPTNRHTPFGHIAVYNGEQWVSDFKQKSIYPSGAYRTVGKYQIFRASDGWHWKHVWTTPVDWYGWIKSAIKGGNKIKY